MIQKLISFIVTGLDSKSLRFFETPEGIAFDETSYSRRKETSNWSLLSTDLPRF
jgi:hypothetical protein